MFDKDTHIDESALDVELLQQPELVKRYGLKLAEAKLNFELKREALDLTRAELDKKIRSNPDKFGITKITETVIMNTILEQEEYTETNKRYLKARFDVDANKVAMDAIQAKGESLANLVRLHGQQYFAGPTIPRNLKEERERGQERSNETIQIRKSHRTK